ncbi:phosphotransferase system mannitol/fructose-specifc IIA component (Ntr-type) [Thioflavicoccus mobilis 8321]|uniref:Phosphotransferase system mannitol/fructose-specifc IIA component (Ntr-type) n=1 Tax=Thioflavicoccus mobilis 8321 TaxID=765912 RepID=L0GXK3_9GAMM|nr:PTS sugar transporter subunit IIA [Thioflavicoccus mobilis]AGA91473.1 phosphotransferase system mannitol/fructose-specifc IIA component (Ntr-type) [Thioflavicoccus mobilis 8321]
MLPPELIVERRIACCVEVTSKKRLLETLGELLASASSSLSPETIFERLVERERLGSTGLGHGIALPHARVPEIKEPIGAFVQLTNGIDYDAIDGVRVDLAFALLVPEAANEMHLKLLADLAGKFSDPDLRTHLRQAAAPSEVLALLAASTP